MCHDRRVPQRCKHTGPQRNSEVHETAELTSAFSPFTSRGQWVRRKAMLGQRSLASRGRIRCFAQVFLARTVLARAVDGQAH